MVKESWFVHVCPNILSIFVNPKVGIKMWLSVTHDCLLVREALTYTDFCASWLCSVQAASRFLEGLKAAFLAKNRLFGDFVSPAYRCFDLFSRAVPVHRDFHQVVWQLVNIYRRTELPHPTIGGVLVPLSIVKKDFNISQDAVGDASPSKPLNPPKCFLFDKYLAGSGFYPQMPQNLICLLSFRGGLKVGVFF